MSKLDENIEKKLRENMECKNTTVYESTLNLIRKGRKKKRKSYQCVSFLEEIHNTMYDFSLIDNLRGLKNIFSNRDSAHMMLGYY